MPSIYNCNLSEDEDNILKELRQKLATVCGVSICGNRVTARWTGKEGRLVDVHMIIERIGTVQDMVNAGAQNKRMRELVKKYPWIEDELYYVEHGESSQ